MPNQGLIQGSDGLGGYSHPPWVCSVHNILCLNTDLLEQTIHVNKVHDEMQINHSDRALHDAGRTLTAARVRELTQSNYHVLMNI